MHMDGRILVAEGEGLAKTRRAMAFAGLIAITLVLDGKGRVAAEAGILTEGMPDAVEDAVREAVEETARRHNPKKSDAEELRETVRRAARRAAQDAWGKKPLTRVTVIEL
jgi:ribonuclease J